MFKIFIITLWLEYDGELYRKYALPLQSDCDLAYKHATIQFEKIKKVKLVALKCTRLKDFRIDKTIYDAQLARNYKPKKKPLLKRIDYAKETN